MRLLVVDDERHLVAALRRGLAAEGFCVDAAADGVSGLARALSGGYDAVVLDIMLPRLSGYEVVRRLRAAGSTVPVLLLSAKDGEYDQADGLDLGADDYLVKPFSFLVLVARLRALLRRDRSRDDDTGAPRDGRARLVVGDLALDSATHRVTRGGTEVELTPKEFALLEFLLRHPDQVLAKSEILDQVWDLHGGGDPNLVEVYVGYLRRKIDTPFGRRTLQTVRGVGYRLAGTGE